MAKAFQLEKLWTAKNCWTVESSSGSASSEECHSPMACNYHPSHPQPSADGWRVIICCGRIIWGLAASSRGVPFASCAKTRSTVYDLLLLGLWCSNCIYKIIYIYMHYNIQYMLTHTHNYAHPQWDVMMSLWRSGPSHPADTSILTTGLPLPFVAKIRQGLGARGSALATRSSESWSVMVKIFLFPLRTCGKTWRPETVFVIFWNTCYILPIRCYVTIC